MARSRAFRALERSAPVFSALGDATRIALIERLSEGPASVTALSERAAITRQAISKHLQVLEGAGLAKNRRVGRESIWALAPGRLSAAQRALEAVSSEWDARIDRLRQLVEAEK